VILKHIHARTNPDDIKKEIEDLEHTVSNIWNIKKQDTKKALHMFYVKLEPKINNKDIYEVGSLLDYRVKLSTLYHTMVKLMEEQLIIKSNIKYYEIDKFQTEYLQATSIVV